MYRIVIDTQIFWRGLTGSPNSMNAKFFDLWLQDQYTVVVSKDIVNEILTLPARYPKIAMKLKIDNKVLALASYFIQSNAEWIKISSRLPAESCRDYKDIKFLECAVSGSVDFIVSADNDLISLKEFMGIKILTVPKMMERITI